MTAPALLQAIACDSTLWVLDTACREFGVPFCREVAQQSCPPPHDLCTVHAALLDLGLESVVVQGAPDGSVPGELWYVLVADVPSIAGGGAGGEGPLLLGRVRRAGDGLVHLTDHRSAHEIAMRTTLFDARYAGYALRVRANASACEGEFDADSRAGRFGAGWFLREMRRYRVVWAEVLVAALCIQVLALIVPLLTQTVIDKVMTHRTANTLIVVAAGFLVATIFSGLLTWLRQYYMLHAGTRIDAVLAADVFSHLLRLPVRYFEQRSTGVLVARMHAVETVREFMCGTALTLILDLPFMLIFGAVMLHYSPVLTAVTAGFLGAIVLISVLSAPALRSSIDRQFLAGARQQAFVTERLAAIETVKSLQLEAVLDRRFELLYGRYLATGLRTRLLSAGIGIGAQSIEQLLTLAVLCAGAWMVVQGAGLTVGALIAFQMFATRLTAPALKIAGLWREFQQVHVAIRRLADIMDTPREPMRGAGTLGTARAGRLECIELGFRYRDRPWLFRGVSFDLAPGQCVALIGPSGSGKSTFSRLLQGFYLPAEGRLRLDGADISSLAANEVRAYFGVVPQETRLFTGTLFDNLTEAAPGADLRQIEVACRAVGIHEVIAAMPEGYFSWVGENGVGLSGGQKQRIAIARAMLRGARILVFDEPTSSLDAALADGLVEAINALRGRISVIFIGHRLPERLRCDAVIAVGSDQTKTP